MIIFDENRSYVIGKLKTTRSNSFDDNGIQFVNYNGLSPIYLTGKQLKEKGIQNSEEFYESYGNKLFGIPSGTYISIYEMKNGKASKYLDAGTILKNNSGLGDGMIENSFVDRYDRSNKEQNNFFKEQLARKEEELKLKDKEIDKLKNMIIEAGANNTELRTTNARFEADFEWYKKKIDELNLRIEELKKEDEKKAQALNDSGADMVSGLAQIAMPLADIFRQYLSTKQQPQYNAYYPNQANGTGVPVNNSIGNTTPSNTVIRNFDTNGVN